MHFFELVFILTAAAICVTIHEVAHAWVAVLLGDSTAKMNGRLTADPLKHLDVLGTLFILMFHGGWGKAVHYNPNNLKRPRFDGILITIAGPLANLLTAFLLGIFRLYFPFGGFFGELLVYVYELSIALFLFNLIPLAPLDGAKLLGFFIPSSKRQWYSDYMASGPLYLVMLALLNMASGLIFNFPFLSYYFAFGIEFFSVFIWLGA